MDPRAQALAAAHALGDQSRPNCCEGEFPDLLWEVEMRNGDWSEILAAGERARYGCGVADHGPLTEPEARRAWERGLTCWPLTD